MRVEGLAGEDDFLGIQNCTSLKELGLYELNLNENDIEKCLMAVFQLKNL